MIKLFRVFVVIIIFSTISCKKSCDCNLVLLESTFATDYEWIEISIEKTNECEIDTMSSTYLDSNGNISYVMSIIQCVE